jgi:hypothetical protein
MNEYLLSICIVPALVAAILLLDQLDRRAARRLKAKMGAPQRVGDWSISLLMDADEAAGVLCPTVQLQGPELTSAITVDLRSEREGGSPSLTTSRWFNKPAVGTDLVLGMIAVPVGVSVASAVQRTWTVVVGQDGRQIARRSTRLAAAECLNDEAEIQAPDLEPAPGPAVRPHATLVAVRHLRWTIGFTLAACSCAVGGYLLIMLSPWCWFAAVPLFLMAGTLLMPAALVRFTSCPQCRQTTSVVGRTGTHRCDSCGRQFSLMPGSL